MLEIELTESVFIEASRGHTGMLARLRALGIRIRIDDFGTGYSCSPTYAIIRQTVYQIAQQFSRGCLATQAAQPLCALRLDLRAEFGIEIIADGVENAEQLDFLVKAGCTDVQGIFSAARSLLRTKSLRCFVQGVLTPHPAPGRQVAAAAEHASGLTEAQDYDRRSGSLGKAEAGLKICSGASKRG